MFHVSPAAEPLTQAFASCFTRPTFQRFVRMITALIVTCGRHTVSRSLRAIEPVLEGHFSNYHRLYSRASYSMWAVALILTRQVIKLLPADAAILLAADDTVDGKGGWRVWGKAPHRDGRRSTRRHVAMKYGHQWLVMCVLLKLPGMSRPWALPILCGLCHSKRYAAKHHLRAKSAGRLSHQLLIRLMRWFPDRRFILLADGRAANHRLACFAARHADRVTLISRIRSDTNLYDPPGARSNKRAHKGRKQPSPRQQLDQLPVREATVAWYGASERQVKLVSATGLWYLVHSRAVVPIRWVCVRGDERLDDAYFYSSDPSLDPVEIVSLYARRWNIEVTFQECRALLGLETTRHWCRQSVLRATPVLFGLFTVVSLMWKQLCDANPRLIAGAKVHRLSETPCYCKQQMTFADALYLVRRELWSAGLLQHHFPRRCSSRFEQLPGSLKNTILNHLAAAA